ncbi:3-isopropylmalate dehydratase small subunit [Roseomonas nepalensis]|uniref:3-isopropylmalate dehydratase small subunit n=1 Tax=Muricoccus nepalensis TaxID=1854500 RepID=A0A502FW56_9PROT|nr:3-isopropylmalate dehydratase small subunit [Roseomonas nepalensis]TPG53512.1 3-isopropylmalate dehydratase small subunit [Roseomonas nepalensis]
MPIEGLVHRVGDHVDTDVIIPGRYLTLRDRAQLGPHCLEGLDPGFAARVGPGDVLVAGRNFGSGSSREHAILALQGAGIAAVVAASVARIFFRNAINLALPVMVCPEAAAALREGEAVELDPVSGRIAQGGREWQAAALAGEVAAILAAGGLVPHLRGALAAGR